MQCETVRDALASGYLQWEDTHYLQVADHLDSCADCRARRESLRALVALLQSADPARELQAPEPVLRRKPRWKGGLLAAAAVLLAAVSGYGLGQRGQPAGVPGPQPQNPVVATVPALPDPAAEQLSVLASEPVLASASVPLLRLDAANLRALRVREFVLQSQVALALRLLEPEKQAAQRELVAEGWNLAAACEQAGERDLAKLLGATSLTLEGSGEASRDKQALADLGRLRLGISSRGPQAERDDIL